MNYKAIILYQKNDEVFMSQEIQSLLVGLKLESLYISDPYLEQVLLFLFSLVFLQTKKLEN